MDNPTFSPIEKAVSFYTRNDFAILNNLLLGNYDALWKYALIAYNDNQAIINEYENGERTIDGDYDIKWLNCLKERLIEHLDDEAKRKVINIAKTDISNILRSMTPTKDNLFLFRTAWIDEDYDTGSAYAYSREYKALEFAVGSILEIKTISSYSLTPYRENEDVGSDFYRYEICVPEGKNVLLLDQFVCHNEDGEVLLPPMKCKVIGICDGESTRCRGIIELEYVEQLPCKEQARVQIRNHKLQKHLFHSHLT